MSHDGAVAALDCGTNSTRLLVTDGSGRALARQMRITRLGQGVDANHRLRPDAVERTLDALREFRLVMDRLGVRRARLAATSAVRDAVNGGDFLGAAAQVTRVDPELLSGEEEGRLSYAGATAGLPEAPTLVIDIGGGSTELVSNIADGVRSVSLDIGCVRLTERYLRSDPPTPGQVADAVVAIGTALGGAEEVIGVMGEMPPGVRLIGLAGTVSTLASLELDLDEYDRDRIHHFVLTGPAVERWCDVLGRETAAERAARPGIPEGREDVIFGGTLVLRQAMRRFGCRDCMVSEADILDGLVMSLLTV